MHKERRKKLPKILLITNDFPPQFSGGISNVYFNLCKNDSRRLLKAIAPTARTAKQLDLDFNLDTVRVWAPTRSGILHRIMQLGLFFSTAIIESYRNDVVAIWCGHVYLTPIAYFLKRLRGLPYFLFMHSGGEEVYLDNRLKVWVFNRLVGNRVASQPPRQNRLHKCYGFRLLTGTPFLV